MNNIQKEQVSSFGLFAGEVPIPLKSTSFTGYLKGMMTHMTMELVFENSEKEAIEAVYNFPIPDKAVFLGLWMKMSGRTYKTAVIERKQAVESYEESVTDGNAAILVEEISPYVYSMQIGNIPPETEIRIEYQYSMLHEWKDGLMRWRLPTVLAPRYGNSGLEQHHEPEQDLLIRHGFEFSLSVEGQLSEIPCISPTHKLSSMRENDTLKLSMENNTEVLDRDLIIHFKKAADEQGKEISVIWDRDINNQYCALLSVCPPAVTGFHPEPKIIKILIDCSASMTGESIDQARIALNRIFTEVRPEDKVMVWKFGSEIEKLHTSPVSIDELDEDISSRIQADLGGTELLKALTEFAGYHGNSPEIQENIFLITDGEVWNEEGPYSDLLDALGDEQRVFSVGVGRAVSTELLNNLAHATGGSVELVTPDEKMASRIISHFKRLYAPFVKIRDIKWHEDPVYVDKFPVLYGGDTVYIGARFEKRPEGEIEISVSSDTEETAVWRTSFNNTPFDVDNNSSLSVLSRTVASGQISGADNKKSLIIALDYQLMSGQTACFAEAELAEEKQSNGQPLIRKIPGMLASGYGGLSKDVHNVKEPFEFCYNFVDDIPYSNTFIDSDDILLQIEQFYNDNNRLPGTTEELLQCGLDEDLIGQLMDEFGDAAVTKQAIALFLNKHLKLSTCRLSKEFTRAIRTAAKRGTK